MTRTVLMACIIAGVAGAAQAATVEFRIVERRSQVAWNPFIAQSIPLNDAVLNFAVQARVVGVTGEALGNFGFNILSNEAESAGTLARAKISIAGTGSYDNVSFANNATLGAGGLASPYTYLASINGAFNGVINGNSGSWTQTPFGDIGLVTGSPTGGAGLLATGPAGGVDGGGFSVPDSWVSGTTALLDPAIGTASFGANGNFIDVYRFNYTMLSTASRVVTFSLGGINAQTFTSLSASDHVWGPASPLDATAIINTPASVSVVPAPGAMALLGLGGLIAARRRRMA